MEERCGCVWYDMSWDRGRYQGVDSRGVSKAEVLGRSCRSNEPLVAGAPPAIASSTSAPPAA